MVIGNPGLLDFLLSLTNPPGTAAGAFWVKSAVIDDSKTAIVWVRVPGFIGKSGAGKKRRNGILF